MGGQLSSEPLVQVEHLGKRVGTSESPLVILEDIGFVVDAGTSIAVLGASGSGKTTLLGLLAGLDLPSAGRVIIDVQNLDTLDEDGRAGLRAAMVGFVFQNFQLLPGMTALENVMLPLELAGFVPPRRRAMETLKRVGLRERLGHYPSQLSGGEQQRCAIARAFATGPRLLFVDEPTGNLDQETGGSIIELLFGLNAAEGITLIMATHDEGLARRCQRRIRLHNGRLAGEEA